MKADLIKYKDYTILFNAHEIKSGSFCPIATLFKSKEKTVTLDIKRTFAERGQALLLFLVGLEINWIDSLPTLVVEHESDGVVFRDTSTVAMMSRHLECFEK